MDQVGFLGLGMMGGSIALRMLDQGIALVGYDPSEAAMERFCQAGGAPAASALEVANRAEVVFACLPNPLVCEQVVSGANGVLNGERLKCYIETSTLGATKLKQLAAVLESRSITVLDAPVSGGATAAREGRITAILSGNLEEIERQQFLINTYAGQSFIVGSSPGDAQLAKLVNNAIAINAMLITFEGICAATAAGLELKPIIEVINASSGKTFGSSVIIPEGILSSNPVRTGHMATFLKDITLYSREMDALSISPELSSILLDFTRRIPCDGDDDVAPTLRSHFLRNNQRAMQA